MKSLYSRYLVIVLLVSLIFSCSKGRGRGLLIEEVINITSSEADIKALFKTRVTDNLEVGVCWSTQHNPIYEYYSNTNYNITVYESKPELKTFNLNKLHASTTYYVRAFINAVDGNNYAENSYLYSSEISFKTQDLAAPPCSLTEGEITVDGTNYSVPAANIETISPFSLTIKFDIGDIEFKFYNEPKSGIYSTTNGFGFSNNDFKINVNGHIPEVYNCLYQVPNDQFVYVNNDEFGNISISFCELLFQTEDPCQSQHTISGMVSN